jgi:FkbH-like protein
LKSLTNRGVLLAIVSKNEEATVLEAFNKHPEMVLKAEDFAGFRINWKDKAENIIELVSELNLGIESVVFIDDNPFERQRVRDALPEVFVPEWPDNQLLYKKELVSLRCFDNPSISVEDVERTQLYAAERQRTELKDRIGSLDEWLKTLGTTVTVEALNQSNLQRTTQLLNKTNQMNLSTRRMTEREMVDWVLPDNRMLWTFRVTDRFGDSGLTGIISLETENERGAIIDFVLSCRVMGRNVEETMLYTVVKYAQSISLEEIHARFLPTQRISRALISGKDQDLLITKERTVSSGK